jgi:FkbM family methyltransferase
VNSKAASLDGILPHSFRLKRFFVHLVKKFVKRFHLKIQRIPQGSDINVLKSFKINLVFDVGANVGQYGISLREQGYSGVIVSFEPMTEAHQKLTRISDSDLNWKVHSPTALGSENMREIFHISANSLSSSLLEMNERHLLAAPQSKYISSEVVRICKLDDVWGQYNFENSVILLKLDVQGFEMNVLKGSESMLNSVSLIQLEMSTTHLYSNQSLYFEIDSYLRSLGFSLLNICPQFWSKTGKLLQYDGIYFNHSKYPDYV